MLVPDKTKDKHYAGTWQNKRQTICLYLTKPKTNIMLVPDKTKDKQYAGTWQNTNKQYAGTWQNTDIHLVPGKMKIKQTKTSTRHTFMTTSEYTYQVLYITDSD
jgi:hypothetical protein